MSAKFLLILAIAATAAAAPQHGNGYGHQQDYHEKRPYAYDYAVHDPHYGAQFSKTEHSNGDNVEGQYSVVLPDGRTQHVKYYADHYGGYNHGNGYGHQQDYHEKRPSPRRSIGNGDNVEGQYSVVLPDGRTQHVKYYADRYGGYNADFLLILAIAATAAAAPQHGNGYGHQQDYHEKRP
ncbi:cuticle protein 7-like [Pollicipes pollicipes]|uniref:cuticle protein 7-like n=1 Tax=Pollicipes pollicipes TaxID=41117 RepID=UPI00188543BA|nr:cuticle protein 7-like [Pollicipes pollicipes]